MPSRMLLLNFLCAQVQRKFTSLTDLDPWTNYNSWNHDFGTGAAGLDREIGVSDFPSDMLTILDSSYSDGDG